MGRQKLTVQLQRDAKDTFAQNVKYYREKAKWSQADLAREVSKILTRDPESKGLSRSAVSAIELGRNSATIGHAGVIAFALGIPLKKLFEE